MSISQANAKIYIARIIGGGNSGQVYDLAAEALLRSFSDWQTIKDWEFILKDSSLGYSFTGVTLTPTSTTINAPTVGAFDGINIGVTITTTSGTAGIPASSTVTNYTRAADGTVASITISAPITGTLDVNATIAISGDIPIIAGVQDYNVPPDFFRAYGARLTTNLKWPLTFIRPRLWNRMTTDQSIQGIVEAYTVFNVISPATQNKGTQRLRVYRIPAKSDVLRLEYYRKLNVTADPLDMDDTYLYKFLDYGRARCLDLKRALDNPGEYSAKGDRALQEAMTDDEEVTEDQDVRMISQMEAGNQARPLWSNGQFNPDYGFYF